MVIDHIEQTAISVLTRPNKPEYGFKSDRKVDVDQTKQNKKMGIKQTERTKLWV